MFWFSYITQLYLQHGEKHEKCSHLENDVVSLHSEGQRFGGTCCQNFLIGRPILRCLRIFSICLAHKNRVMTNKAIMVMWWSEAWVLRKREEQRLEATQMKVLRHLLGITKLDKEKNQCIRGKTGKQNIVKEIKQYQKKWLQHVQRMDTNRIPRQALKYRPEGRRNIGRPKKRWRDQLHFEE